MIVLGILVIGFIHNIVLAGRLTSQLRQETGLAKNPLAAFFRIRQLADAIPTNTPIFFAIDPATHKMSSKACQMLIYALCDRALAGNWRYVNYVAGLLPADQQDLSSQPCRWMISMDSPVPPTASRAGNIWLNRYPSTDFALQSAIGGLGCEVDSTGSWYWVPKQLHFTYRIQGDQPNLATVTLSYLALSDRHPIRLAVAGQNFELATQPGWHEWTSPPFPLHFSSNTLDVVFACDAEPGRLSTSDPRIAAYLIKNLTLKNAD